MAESKKPVDTSSTRPKIYSSGDSASNNRGIVYPHHTGRPTKSKWRNTKETPTYQSKSADDNFSFETTLNGGLVLKVYKASVTNLNVEVIVNAANETMVHSGGVAKVISDAAGVYMDSESKSFVDTHGPLEVGKNIVTTAGKLPNQAVIHAVGPMWYDYRDKLACLDDLYDCIYNIMDTCKKNCYKTVAMTAISAGIFAVPKELCADMYVFATVNFCNTRGAYECPRELHIIDVDTSILRLVEKSVQRWMKDPQSLNQRLTLPKFLKDNPKLARYTYRRDQGQKTDGDQGQSSEREIDKGMVEMVGKVEKKRDEHFSWGGVAKQYIVGGQIKVKIYQGDLCKVRRMDAIVCAMSKDLKPQGSVVAALKTAGGDVYHSSYKKMIDKRKQDGVRYSDVFKCEGGNLGAKYVTHAVIKRVVDANARETEAYEGCIASVLEKVRRNRLVRIAVPMIGTGLIQTNKRKLKLCGKALLKALEEFIIKHGNKHELSEIHLINNKYTVDRALVEVFDEASDLQDKAERVEPKRGSGEVYDQSTPTKLHENHSSGGRRLYSDDSNSERSRYQNGGNFSGRNRRGQGNHDKVKTETRSEGASERSVDGFHRDDSDQSRADARKAPRPSDLKDSKGNMTILDN